MGHASIKSGFALITVALCALRAGGVLGAEAVPAGVVPVGKSPFALSVSGDQQAVVVNLFPEGPGSDPAAYTNTKVVNLAALKVETQMRVGTRLVSIAVSGTSALVVNEDQDYVYVLDLLSGITKKAIPVGSRPSNVIVANASLAIVANGTSGDISFIDLNTLSVKGSPVKVGSDPRSVALHPSGDYAYVALGGENSVGVVDLRQAFGRVATTAEVKKVKVGKDPVSISVTPDGSRAVVANMNNNTVSVLDLSDPASPYSKVTPDGTYQIPVGVQPTAVEVSPDGRMAYVANLGSGWFSAVDLAQLKLVGVVYAKREDPSAPGQYIASATSSVRVTPDGTRLLVTEFRRDANLLVYDLKNMPLAAAPIIEVPGEPRGDVFLKVTPGLGCPGFYIAEATLAEGAQTGYWGMEVSLTSGDRLLQGGVNLGGGFDANGGNPGFGAFYITNPANEPQKVVLNLTAQAVSTPGFPSQNLGLSVRILDGQRKQIGDAKSGTPPLNLTIDRVNPGFYIVEIQSLKGSPRGAFQLELSSQYTDRPGGGFTGGFNVGGYMNREGNGSSSVGFVAFCIAEGQTVKFRTMGNATYGEAAAGDLILTIRDSDRKVVRTIVNSTQSSGGVKPPDPPDMEGAIPNIFVDAKATSNGDGSSARPFKSITAAVAKANPGDVILVRPGTYSPSLTGEVIPIGGGGENVSPLKPFVKVFGSGAETTIINAEARSTTNGNAVVIPVDEVRFAGFTVRGSTEIGMLVWRAKNVRIDGNFFTSNIRFGFGAIECTGLTVAKNVSVANQESGMAFSGCSSTRITENVCNDNRADGILGGAGGSLYIGANTTLNNGSSGIELNNRAETGQAPPLVATIKDNTVNNNGGVQFAFAGTGILIAEGARAAEISGNLLINNRPYGIGIFEHASADLISKNRVIDTQYSGILVSPDSTTTEISDNTITNSGLCGIFIDENSSVERILRNSSTLSGSCADCPYSKSGLAVLGASSVGLVSANFFDNNYVGVEVSGNSTVTSMTDCTMDGNSGGGIFIRSGSNVVLFDKNKVRNNGGQGGLLISGSRGTISNSEISGNEATGFSFYSASQFALTGNTITGNKGEGGVFLCGGTLLTLTSNIIGQNLKAGILSAENGTLGKLSGNTVTNNQGIGMNAQNGGQLQCTGSNTISGNTGGNVFGSVTGCN